MAKRWKPNQAKAHKRFTKTAMNVHKKNVAPPTHERRLQDMSEVAKKGVVVDTSSLALERLRRAAVRRERKYINDRVVYAYRHFIHGMSDNLILLPFDSKESHRAFLEYQISSVIQSGTDASKLRGYKIVKIGVFNKEEMSFKKCSPVVVVDIDSLIDNVEVLKKKEEKNV